VNLCRISLRLHRTRPPACLLASLITATSPRVVHQRYTHHPAVAAAAAAAAASFLRLSRFYFVIDKTFKNKYFVFRYNRINVKGTPPSMSSSLLIRSVFSATLHGMALVPYCMFQVLIDFDPVKRIDAGGDTIKRVR